MSNNRIIAITEENVLAALSLKTGEILWRKVFEKSNRGELKLLHVQNEMPNVSEEIITISGSNPALLRGWNSGTGNMEWEWSLTPTSPVNTANTLWFYDKLYIYHIVPVYNSHIELTVYFGSTGQQIKPTTTRISTPWITKDGCVLAAPYFVCTVKNQILAIDLTSESNEILTNVLDRDVSNERPTVLPVSLLL